VPKILILAGPNGAGKTTFAREFLPNEAACKQFVNADFIAVGISPIDPGSADVAAGKAMLERLDELTRLGIHFALETTLSGRWLVKRIEEWKLLGYYVELRYLRLSSPDLAVQRVKERVEEGGHDIPEATIRRWFERGLQLLEVVYKPAVDAWIVYDNDGVATILEFGENR
jgi:predicted ABC-type ATPase